MLEKKNIGIGQDKELKFIEEENIREIGRLIMKNDYCVDKTAEAVLYHSPR